MAGLFPPGATMSSDVLTTPVPAQRSVVIAGLLSAIAPGVGQLYAGRPWRAATFFVAMLVVEGAILGCTLLVPPTFAAVVGFGVAAITVTLGVYLYAIVDAVLLARHSGGAPYHWYVHVAAVAAAYLVFEVALLAVPSVRAYQPWRTFSVPSASMEPTLRLGEIFIADVTHFDANAPARGDVVVYRLPNDPGTIYVKRIVALPGDRVAFRAGRVFINGVAAREPYAKFGDPASPINTFAEFAVPASTVFVAGDNRDNSTDSRVTTHGPVPFDNLIGRATEILMTSLPDRAGVWVGAPR
jgi:signal peptidase I